MYLPSEQIRKSMEVERAGLWIEATQSGHVLLVKGNTPLLKMIYKGVKTELVLADVLSRQIRVWCLGFRIFGDEARPITIMHCVRLSYEQEALAGLVVTREIDFHLYDEMERHVARCKCELERESANAMNLAIRSSSGVYTGEFNSSVDDALDIFSRLINGREDQQISEGAHVIPLELKDWTLTTIVGIGSGRFRLDEDEGGGLEQSAHQLVESLFGERGYRSPELRTGTGRRELTDSLLVSDLVCCLLETKALSIFRPDPGMTLERRASNMMKDIKKGLRQLKGAVRSLRAGTAVYSSGRRVSGLYGDPQPIELPDRDCVILGFVLVSDLEIKIAWSRITKQLLESSEGNALFQILDLTELRSLIGTAINPLQFVSNAILRFAKVREEQNAQIRIRVWRE